MMERQLPMRRPIRGFLLAALCASFAGALLSTAWGQAPTEPAKPAVAPPPADLEPGVNTSATQTSSSEPVAAAPAPGRIPAKEAGAGTKAAPAAGTARSRTASKPGAPAGKAQDKIELDTTQITGNRELPKVLYIVPWKRSDLGDLVGKPVNSLLDEVLTPVDRDVFKRQNRYYDALKPDEAKDAAGVAEKH